VSKQRVEPKGRQVDDGKARKVGQHLPLDAEDEAPMQRKCADDGGGGGKHEAAEVADVVAPPSVEGREAAETDRQVDGTHYQEGDLLAAQQPAQPLQHGVCKGRAGHGQQL
jgi:hypothetical protein